LVCYCPSFPPPPPITLFPRGWGLFFPFSLGFSLPVPGKFFGTPQPPKRASPPPAFFFPPRQEKTGRACGGGGNSCRLPTRFPTKPFNCSMEPVCQFSPAAHGVGAVFGLFFKFVPNPFAVLRFSSFRSPLKRLRPTPFFFHFAVRSCLFQTFNSPVLLFPVPQSDVLYPFPLNTPRTLLIF